MFGLNYLKAPASLERAPAALSSAGVTTRARRIALLRSGRRHGPITRLITPWDIGELTQPFLFLGYCEFTPGWQPLLAVHPQPRVATLTLVLSGTLGYEDAAGNERTVTAGGFKWTSPGERVRHDGGHATREPLRAFQLWMGIAPSPQSSAAESQHLASHEVEEEGPVRVLLGQFGRARSALAHAAPDINYFHVRLRDGERWCYVAPERHNVTWLAVDRGGVRLGEGERVYWEQIALFGDSRGVIELQADGETSFVLGSATRLDHPLVQDNPLIDATLTALTPGEEGRRRVERRLAAQGRR
jgi:redox-sensitive bicupin YhaK (pirin superfamily)